MNIPDLMQEKITEESIKQELEQSLSSRVQRYLKVKPHGIVPYTRFAPASAECTFLFRDGHFYGCIALAQAVAEAIVRFLCQRNSWRPGNNFEKNVQTLCTRKFISHAPNWNHWLKTWRVFSFSGAISMPVNWMMGATYRSTSPWNPGSSSPI